MPDWPRRRALQALGTAATVALAGCSGSGGFEDPPTEHRGDPVTEYEILQARDPEGAHLFWEGAQDAKPENPRRYEYVTSTEDFEDLSFAPDSDAAAELEQFVAATDLASSSVLLQFQQIEECYELRLLGVWREDDGLETDYCSTLRSAAVECSRDQRDTVGVAIRLPFSLADATSFSFGLSSGCEPEPLRVGRGASSEGGEQS